VQDDKEMINGDHHIGGSDSAGEIVVPFLIGTIVGGVAGAVAGTLLSEHTTHLATSIIKLIDRRLNEADRERLRFELLLQ
jgi:hypothetical protein